MAPNSLVVGIGNPLLGADAFGPAVVAALREDPSLPAHAQLIDAHTDLLAFIDRFAAADTVVLVDAYVGDGSGDVSVFDESTFSQWSEESPSSHQMSALVAVGLFRRLYPAAKTRISLVALNVDGLSAGVPVAAESVAAGVASVMPLIAA